jgi:hypothetical protein
MKTAAFAIALLMSGTTFAQTTTTTDDMTDHSAMAHGTMTATGQVVQPANSNPEEDARGISVISAPAFVPTGWNGTAGTAVGGPMVDPATGEAASGAESNYPACTATITDNCVQTYERGRRS